MSEFIGFSSSCPLRSIKTKQEENGHRIDFMSLSSKAGTSPWSLGLELVEVLLAETVAASVCFAVFRPESQGAG